MTLSKTIPSIAIEDVRLSSWKDVTDAFNHLSVARKWAYRGHQQAEWCLQSSIERLFGNDARNVEQSLLWPFVRTAPRFMAPHLVPGDNNAAAWLGLIQHYGGPTRLMDVTRSPYVALFFAFEAPGKSDRAVWAIDQMWCMAAAAKAMAVSEGCSFELALSRTTGAQEQLVYSLVHRQNHPDRLFKGFKPFVGVFPVDPWKPDVRQLAQQAAFLCPGSIESSFEANLATYEQQPDCVYRFILPSDLRNEVIHRLADMNVSASTLFPDIGGLARSLRTFALPRTHHIDDSAPWKKASQNDKAPE